MSIEQLYKHIQLDYQSVTQKFVQISNGIIQAIEKGVLQEKEVLPSINDISAVLEVSRDTAEKAYKHLKQLGVVASIPGKGYFITNTQIKQQYKVLLMFNKLSQHKKIIYDHFVNTIGNEASIDFYIYNNDVNAFKNILENKKGKYTHFVIIPHFIEGHELAAQVINDFVDGELIILDKQMEGVTAMHSVVEEKFEKDIVGALVACLPQLTKYHQLQLIFPSESYFPEDIKKGLIHFCNEYAFNYKIIDQVPNQVETGNVYINLMEDDLMHLLNVIVPSKLKVGKDIGIISYNETPWKAFILNGITTISTNFQIMGEQAAKLILEKRRAHVEVPFATNIRASL